MCTRKELSGSDVSLGTDVLPGVFEGTLEGLLKEQKRRLWSGHALMI